MKVEVVSRENIRPSSSSSTCATPPHPRSHTLSAKDQTAVSSYSPFVFFYSPPRVEENRDMHRILKDSLSQVLTCFYPLAGRINDDCSTTVDCNDQGVEYAQARVNCNISSVLEKPSMEMLGQLTPTHKLFATCNDPFVLVQANSFLCGGLALAFKISHKLADGTSISTFIKGWSKTALGYPDSVVPDFTTISTRFPPAEGYRFSTPPRMFQELLSLEGIARRFVFEGSKISELKEKMANDQVRHPTRVEAVSCFLWKRIVSLSRAQGGMERITALLGGMNARASLVPPLPEYSFGNAVNALCVMGNESEIESTGGLSLFREARNGKNAAAVASMMHKKTDDEMKSYLFVSLCRSPFYEADFGWGKPTWVSWEVNATNVIALLDSSDGHGIEVWVNLFEQEMVLLEQDKELLEFAALNPPVLLNTSPSCCKYPPYGISKL